MAFVLVNLVLLPVGRVWAAFWEWTVHRFLFHELGKKKGSIFSFHYHEHHRACRKEEMVDREYVNGSLFAFNGRSREIWSCLAGSALHLPLLPFAPGFVLGAWYGGMRYHWCHYKSHVDIEWCKRELHWHYEHHMAPNQDTNWGVSNEWFDKWMGTRTVWNGPKKKSEANSEQPESEPSAAR